METFPSNSRFDKPEPKKISAETQEDKRVERVTTNDVVRRKTPLSRRLREAFGGDDTRTVADYVLMDVMVPAAKDMMVDAVTQGFERLIFGEARSSTRRAAASRGNSGYVSYNRFSGKSVAPKDEARPTISRRARVNHDFDEIILETRLEAEQVLERLYDIINRYDSATVADLYDLVGITGEFTDNKWGWTNLHGSGVTRVRNGYLLDLPKPEPVE